MIAASGVIVIIPAHSINSLLHASFSPLYLEEAIIYTNDHYCYLVDTENSLSEFPPVVFPSCVHAVLAESRRAAADTWLRLRHGILAYISCRKDGSTTPVGFCEPTSRC